MPSAFWIAHVTVSDDEAYGKYAALATKAIAEHGGTFLARGGTSIQKEGQEALSHARGASERDLVLVEALD